MHACPRKNSSGTFRSSAWMAVVRGRSGEFVWDLVEDKGSSSVTKSLAPLRCDPFSHEPVLRQDAQEGTSPSSRARKYESASSAQNSRCAHGSRVSFNRARILSNASSRASSLGLLSGRIRALIIMTILFSKIRPTTSLGRSSQPILPCRVARGLRNLTHSSFSLDGCAYLHKGGEKRRNEKRRSLWKSCVSLRKEEAWSF